MCDFALIDCVMLEREVMLTDYAAVLGPRLMPVVFVCAGIFALERVKQGRQVGMAGQLQKIREHAWMAGADLQGPMAMAAWSLVMRVGTNLRLLPANSS